MNECPKDCLSCSHSFSEPNLEDEQNDILHCMLQDGKIVDENDCCEDYN